MFVYLILEASSKSSFVQSDYCKNIQNMKKPYVSTNLDQTKISFFMINNISCLFHNHDVCIIIFKLFAFSITIYCIHDMVPQLTYPFLKAICLNIFQRNIIEIGNPSFFWMRVHNFLLWSNTKMGNYNALLFLAN